MPDSTLASQVLVQCDAVRREILRSSTSVRWLLTRLPCDLGEVLHLASQGYTLDKIAEHQNNDLAKICERARTLWAMVVDLMDQGTQRDYVELHALLLTFARLPLFKAAIDSETLSRAQIKALGLSLSENLRFRTGSLFE